MKRRSPGGLRRAAKEAQAPPLEREQRSPQARVEKRAAGAMGPAFALNWRAKKALAKLNRLERRLLRESAAPGQGSQRGVRRRCEARRRRPPSFAIGGPFSL